MGAADLEAQVPTFGRPIFATASGRQALAKILSYLRLGPSDEVWISTTLGDRDRQVSPCVTATVARYCRFAFQPGPRTAAALVIHDFGVPHPDVAAVRDRCRRHGWPLIEDAAHAFASTDSAGRRMGEEANFALFSLPKFFDLAAGGLVMGLPPPAAGIQDGAVAAQLAPVLSHTAAIARQRRRNWQRLDRCFAQFGLHSALALTRGSVPSLYLLHTPQQFSIMGRLRSAGIETGPDIHCGRVMLPCHQSLCPEEIRRIVAAVTGEPATATVGTEQKPFQSPLRPLWLTAGHSKRRPARPS